MLVIRVNVMTCMTVSVQREGVFSKHSILFLLRTYFEN